LNRTTLGVSLASLFSDVSHEMATSVLPAFLLSLGAGPAALGMIEGGADGLSALAKLWGGVAADRVQRRKPLASIGYFITGIGTAAIGVCTSAWQVLLCRVVAWIGRGSRGPARDVLMAEGSPAEAHGRAFGLERSADATGAVLGPLLAMFLLGQGVAPRRLLLVSVVPGFLAFLAIALLVVEGPHVPRRARFSLFAELEGTGRPFRRYLSGILIFGCGDFSRTLLILYATQHMTGSLFSLPGAAAAVALYVLHNAVSAIAAFPLGALADRIGHRRLIVGGYLVAAATTLGFALAPPRPRGSSSSSSAPGSTSRPRKWRRRPTRRVCSRRTGGAAEWACSRRRTALATWFRAPSWACCGRCSRSGPGALVSLPPFSSQVRRGSLSPG
jgi:MFS family permease